jgi:hypothetical protein
MLLKHLQKEYRMIRYAIRRIQLFSAFKFGCLTGGILMLPFGLGLGLLGRILVGILRRWLETWEALSLEFAGKTLVDVNFLSILKLSDFLRELRVLDDQGWLPALTLALGTAVLGGLLVGLLALFGAAIYNVLAAISGGLVVGADVLDGMAVPSTPTAAPPPPKGYTLPLPKSRAGPVAQPASGAWLASSQNPEQRWSLKPGVTTLGSAPGNDVVLVGLASRHAEIRFETNYYVLYDLAGGQTWVNGRPISRPNMLKEGFKVRLGNHELVFHKT